MAKESRKNSRRTKQPSYIVFPNTVDGVANRLKYQDKLLALYHYALHLSAAENIEEIARSTLDAMEFALAFDFAYVGFVQDGVLSIDHARGIQPHVTRLPLDGAGVTVKAAISKRTVNVPDTRSEPSYVDQMGLDWKDTPTMLSELAVPSLIDNELVAVLNVESRALHAFNEEDEILLEMLAVLVATHVRRIRSLQALQRSRARFKTLVDHLPVGVYETDSNGRLLEVNHALARILGYDDVAELKSLDLNSFFVDKSLRSKNVAELKPGTPYTAEFALRRKDGECIWVRDDMIAIQREGHVIFHGTLSDTTERMRTEQNLRESEARYRAVVEHQTDLINRHTADTKLTFVNEPYCRYFGKTREGLIGSSWLRFLSDQEREKVLAYRSKISPDNPSVTYDEHIVMPSGEERWQQWTDTAIFGKDGDIIEFLGVGRDVTKRLEYERKLGALHEHASKLSSARSVSEIVTHTLDAMQFSLGFGVVAFLLIEEGILRVKGTRGMRTTPHDLPLNGPGVTVTAAKKKTPVRVHDTRNEPAYVNQSDLVDPESTREMRSEIAVPVIVDRETVAVLNAENTTVAAFSETDEQLLEILAFHVASEIKRLADDQEIRKSEERYRFLYEESPAFNAVLDADGAIKDINKSALTTLGLTKEEVIGRHALEVVAPGQKERVAAVLAGEAETHESAKGVEVEVLAKNGLKKTILFSPGVVKIEEKHHPTAVLVTGMDISDRKAMQEQAEHYSKQLEALVIQRTKSLRESQEKLAAIIQASPESITVTDVDGTIIDCNQATVKMHDFASRDELVGKNIRLLIAQKDHEIAAENAKRTLELGLIREIGYTCLTKGGREFPAEFSVSVLRDVKGQPIAFVAVTKDLTEHNELDERLRKAERMAAIGETATMVAHDLRNPLQGITGAAYFLREKTNGTKDRDLGEVFDLIDNCVQYSNKIVDDLLDYAREPRLKVEKTTLQAIVAEALLQVKIPPQIEMENYVSGEQPIFVDRSRMQRVVINLIRNAVEAMPTGGKLTISSKEDSSCVQLSVSDTGPGIPDELKERIWKPLKTTKAKGVGLGLTICKRFVEAHRGNIEVQSKVGSGATFTVTLPLADANKSKLQVASSPPSSKVRNVEV